MKSNKKTLRSMTYYNWLNNDKTRLSKSQPEGVAISIEQIRTEYKIYGRYTAHDNYMGHTFSDNLLAVTQLLKKETIEYSLVEGSKLVVGDFYLQTDTFVLLTAEAYQGFRKFLK